MQSEKKIAVEFRNICKSFGVVQANKNLNLTIPSGSIHAIIGENGAGKSTAMKMLFGMYAPTSGELYVNGTCIRWRNSQEAIFAGIGMVHQHFMLSPVHSALDNILLGSESCGVFGKINRERAKKEIQALAEKYGLGVSLDKKIDSLSVGEQQRVEILKLLFRKSEILILDEPTAVLTPQEVQDFFQNLKKLQNEGKTIILITHKLREVMAIAEAVTVMRAGEVVAKKNISDTTVAELAELMVGDKLTKNTEHRAEIGKDVLLSAENIFNGISFQVHSHEIVGIAGVEGNGQSELLQSLLFPKEKLKNTISTVHLLGKNITKYTPRKIRELGLGVLAEDRIQQSMIRDSNLIENFILGYEWKSYFQKSGFLKWRNAKRLVEEALIEYDVRPRNSHILAKNLSGGNQQKLVVAREFLDKPRFLIAAQPTRGVDIGAVSFIHQKILDARDTGSGVLLISSELEEIMKLADRIFVIYNKKFLVEFARKDANEKELGFYMGGGTK